MFKISRKYMCIIIIKEICVCLLYINIISYACDRKKYFTLILSYTLVSLDMTLSNLYTYANALKMGTL